MPLETLMERIAQLERRLTEMGEFEALDGDQKRAYVQMEKVLDVLQARRDPRLGY